MALILYPAENWDSFASVEAADIIIGGFVDDGGYLTLDEAGKEAILRQTALQIKLCKNITLPATLESDLEVAQCYLVTYAMTVNMLAYDPNGRAVTGESVGEISVSYDASYKSGDASSFPPMTESLLNQYGCSSSTGGFSQGYVGVS